MLTVRPTTILMCIKYALRLPDYDNDPGGTGKAGRSNPYEIHVNVTREGYIGRVARRYSAAGEQKQHGAALASRIVVLGVGNTLLCDEGVGVHVARVLAERLVDDDTVVIDAGTLSFVLAGFIDNAESLVFVDAAQLDAEPGTVRVYEGEAMDRFIGTQRKLSVHEVSLLDLLQVARLTNRLPARRALVGIQPESTDWGESPTAAIAAAVPVACEAVETLIARWRADRGDSGAGAPDSIGAVA